MKVSCKVEKVEKSNCDVLIVNLFEGVKTPSGATASVNSATDNLIKEVIKEEEFKGSTGSTLLIRTKGLIPAKKVIVVGLGEKKKFDLWALRKAYAAAIRKAKASGAKTVSTILHGAGEGDIDTREAAQTIAEISQLALYDFDKYKSKDKKSPKKEVTTVTIIESSKSKKKAIDEGIKRGSAFAKAQRLARDLVTEPAEAATPTMLANTARKIARENKLRIKVLDKAQCKKLGMNAFLAVGRGSDEPPKFIEIKYTPKGKAKKHIAIVGKGVTFDSGGYSLKPSKAMDTMKMDMSGSAAVIATMSAIKDIRPDVAVTMIVAACENMVNGHAYKLGDVFKAMNGKTIEIMNTDAEGRVTLADSLSYAAKQKPDAIIDLATLTGACVVALGDYSTGVMTNNQKLANKVIEAGNEIGERMWQLPLLDEDRAKIKSPIADMINTGSRGGAGAQNGAVLLENFVSDIPWVHLDIAGPAWIDSPNAYGPKGPTGVGARTLLNFLDKYASKI